MNKVDNWAKGIIGKRIDKEVADEAEHFITCAACGQAIDMRDLGQVFHHEEPGHEPLTTDS